MNSDSYCFLQVQDSFKNCDLPQIINYQQFTRDRQIPAGIGRISVNLCHICASHKAYAHDYVRKLKAVAVSLVGPLSGMGWHITSYTASTSAACASSPTDGQIWLRRGRPVCVGLMFVSISLFCCGGHWRHSILSSSRCWFCWSFLQIFITLCIL